MRSFSKLFRRLRHQPRWRIHTSALGIELWDDAAESLAWQISWTEISSVWAFKRDQYVVDQICINIILRGRRVAELQEEMAGWKDLIEALPEHLPGHLRLEEWFNEVAFPAFATNPTKLYPVDVRADAEIHKAE